MGQENEDNNEKEDKSEAVRKKASKKVKFSTTHVLESIPTSIIKLDIPKSILKEKEEEENNNIQSPVVCSSQMYPRSSGHMIKSSRWKKIHSVSKFCKKCNRNTMRNRWLKNKSRRKMNHQTGKGKENGQILYLLFAMV